VHQSSAYDLTAKMLADRLMTEAYAKERRPSVGAGGDKIKADACLVRGAGSWREKKCARAAGKCLARRNSVVSNDFDFGSQLHQIVDEVPGEAVVIVDDEDHGSKAIVRQARGANGNQRVVAAGGNRDAFHPLLHDICS